MARTATRLAFGVAALAGLASAGANAPARAGAEVKVDREFLAGLVEKLPPAPFRKEGQYRGSAHAFRLSAIDPKTRRVLVACEVSGDYRPPIAGAVRRDDAGWKAFAFDVRVAVRVEPGPDGVPKFRVDVEEVKRRELEGLPGALARVLGRHFDRIVTEVADGKAASLGEKLNARLRTKLAAFQEYGVLREVGYTADQLVLTFDVTKYRRDGVAGYVFAAPRPGTVPLHRWMRPRLGDRYYTTRSDAIPGHPYYVYEAVACHVFAAPGPGTVPLHRWRGPREWFYTTANDGEGVARWGYRPETVACHVYPAPSPDTVPLYRFVDPVTRLHFYSTHPNAEFLK